MKEKPNDTPIYTGYTDEEIQHIEMVNREIGRLEEEKRKLDEELFRHQIQQTHHDLQRI